MARRSVGLVTVGMNGEGGPRSFWRIPENLIVWIPTAAVMTVVYVGPILLLQEGFHRWIDVPGCRRNCAERGLAFHSFASSKSTYDCTCIGAEGLRVFHDRAQLTGGNSLAGCAVDSAFRVVTTLVVGMGWAFFLGACFVWISLRRKRRSRGTKD
jgi:hypothetical protein